MKFLISFENIAIEKFKLYLIDGALYLYISINK